MWPACSQIVCLHSGKYYLTRSSVLHIKPLCPHSGCFCVPVKGMQWGICSAFTFLSNKLFIILKNQEDMECSVYPEDDTSRNMIMFALEHHFTALPPQLWSLFPSSKYILHVYFSIFFDQFWKSSLILTLSVPKCLHSFFFFLSSFSMCIMKSVLDNHVWYI